MSNKNKNKSHENNANNEAPEASGASSAPALDGPDTSGAQAESAIQPQPSTAKPLLPELFATYRETQTNVEAHISALESAELSRSSAIEQIYNHYGSGPFSFKGKKVKVRQRKGFFYFNTEGETTVIEVE